MEKDLVKWDYMHRGKHVDKCIPDIAFVLHQKAGRIVKYGKHGNMKDAFYTLKSIGR